MNALIRKLNGANMDIDLATPGGMISWELAAIRRLAQAEGIVLDPVYAGKVFAGLLDLIEQQELGRDEPIIFVHTGGLPALYAL